MVQADYPTVIAELNRKIVKENAVVDLDWLNSQYGSDSLNDASLVQEICEAGYELNDSLTLQLLITEHLVPSMRRLAVAQEFDPYSVGRVNHTPNYAVRLSHCLR